MERKEKMNRKYRQKGKRQPAMTVMDAKETGGSFVSRPKICLGVSLPFPFLGLELRREDPDDRKKN